MANTPRKMHDPTEAALSAIQDALSVREGDEPAPRSSHPASIDPVDRGSEGRRRGSRAVIDEQLFFEETTSASEQPEPSQPAAANDDRQAVGRVLHGLQRRRSWGPYVLAALLALAWIAAGVLLALPHLAEGGQPVGDNSLQLYGLAVAFGMPVVFFFLLAHMLSRAQELRFIARSMADAAMRLGEPESLAGESIVSVGQAIRREVAAMGDGVERALA